MVGFSQSVFFVCLFVFPGSSEATTRHTNKPVELLGWAAIFRAHCKSSHMCVCVFCGRVRVWKTVSRLRLALVNHNLFLITPPHIYNTPPNWRSKNWRNVGWDGGVKDEGIVCLFITYRAAQGMCHGSQFGAVLCLAFFAPNHFIIVVIQRQHH